jgi:hypothetical protein
MVSFVCSFEFLLNDDYLYVILARIMTGLKRGLTCDYRAVFFFLCSHVKLKKLRIFSWKQEEKMPNVSINILYVDFYSYVIKRNKNILLVCADYMQPDLVH